MHFFLGNRKLVKADEESAATGLEGLAAAVDSGVSADDILRILSDAYPQPSLNLFDNSEENITRSVYVNDSSGELLGSSKYAATSFIKVEPNTEYTRNFAHQMAFYNKDMQYISGRGSQSKFVSFDTFTTPNDAAYARFTVANLDKVYFQVVEGVEGTTYQQYDTSVSNLDVDSTDNPYKSESLRKTHYKLAKLSLPTPEDTQLIISIGGDSYSHNRDRWVGGFTEYMIDKYGDAGGGWCGFGYLDASETLPFTLGDNQPTYLNGNARAGYDVQLVGNVSTSYYEKVSPDMAYCSLNSSGEYVQVSLPVDSVDDECELVFIGTTDGAIKYSWDGGSTYHPIDVQGSTTSTLSVDISTDISQGATLLIEHVSGTCKLCGVILKSSNSGVRVNKLALTGSRVEQWSEPEQQFRDGFSLLNSDLFIYMDGANSQYSSCSGTKWGLYLLGLLADIQTANSGVDLLVITPPENQRDSNTVAISDYADEMKYLVQSIRMSYLDLQDAFGDKDNPDEYGYDGDVPLFSSDNLHPEPQTGGKLMLHEILRVVE